MEEIRLICLGDEVVSVQQKTAEKSKLIQGLLEDDEENKTIEIKDLTKPIVEKAMEFCSELTRNPMVELQRPLNDKGVSFAGNWYETFITEGVDNIMLMDLANAGKFLNIDELLWLACAKIAADLQELQFIVPMRDYFGITDDDVPIFTKEQQKKIFDLNIWIDEARPIEEQLGGEGRKAEAQPNPQSSLPFKNLGLLATKEVFAFLDYEDGIEDLCNIMSQST